MTKVMFLRICACFSKREIFSDSLSHHSDIIYARESITFPGGLRDVTLSQIFFLQAPPACWALKKSTYTRFHCNAEASPDWTASKP